MIAPLTQENAHWQATINGDGNTRLFSNQVWQPWAMEEASWWQFCKSGDKKLPRAPLQARAARSETTAKLSYELVAMN